MTTELMQPQRKWARVANGQNSRSSTAAAAAAARTRASGECGSTLAAGPAAAGATSVAASAAVAAAAPARQHKHPQPQQGARQGEPESGAQEKVRPKGVPQRSRQQHLRPFAGKRKMKQKGPREFVGPHGYSYRIVNGQRRRRPPPHPITTTTPQTLPGLLTSFQRLPSRRCRAAHLLFHRGSILLAKIQETRASSASRSSLSKATRFVARLLERPRRAPQAGRLDLNNLNAKPWR